jgi:hypothetical protein
MLLNNANYIIEEIVRSQSEVPVFDGLRCWEKSFEDYKIYIFSIQISKEKDLVEVSGKLRDYIAIYFQSQFLQKMVEKWNVYQVVIVNEIVNPQSKQKIEQDKFATRKLVFSNLTEGMTDLEVNTLISDEVFNFKIAAAKTDFMSFKDFIVREDAEVIDIVSGYSALGVKRNIDKIIDRLNDE